MLPKNPKSAIEDSQKGRDTLNQLWTLCLSYTVGKQNLVYSSKDNRFVTPQEREIVFNLLLNIFRNVTSRLAVAYPNVAVYPASPSQEDILKAQSSELLLRYTWAEQNMVRKFQELAQWLITCGNAGLYTYYDPDKADVVVKVVSPYDIFFEEHAASEEESSWVAVRNYINKTAAKDAYPSFADHIDEQPQAQRSYTSIGAGEDMPKDTIELIDFFTKDGKQGCAIGNEWVFESDLPDGYQPIQLVKYTEIPGMLWGWSMIAPLIDIQAQYNRTRNQIIKNTELMANPKWMIPTSSGVNAQAITDMPGEKVQFNPAGGAPYVAAMPALPNYVPESAMMLANEILDISGVHSISLGKRAVGITSGVAIENLAALDASQLQLTQNNIEAACRIVGKNILILAKHYYTEAKFVRMMDSTGKMIFKQLSSTDVVDDPELFIEAGSLFQSELQDKEQRTMQMLQLGLLTPQEAKESLNLHVARKDMLEDMAAANHAQKMLIAIVKGEEIEIFSDDDLPTFRTAFKEMMADDSFYLLPEEIQHYVSDLYKSILSALKNNALLAQQGGTPDHESIMQSKKNVTGNLEMMAQTDSNTMKTAIAGDTINNMDKQIDLNAAERGEAAAGGIF